MEDFVTWVDSSKIKQHVLNYNEEVSFLGQLLFNFKAAFCLDWTTKICHWGNNLWATNECLTNDNCCFSRGTTLTSWLKDAVKHPFITFKDRKWSLILIPPWKLLEERSALTSAIQWGQKEQILRNCIMLSMCNDTIWRKWLILEGCEAEFLPSSCPATKRTEFQLFPAHLSEPLWYYPPSHRLNKEAPRVILMWLFFSCSYTLFFSAQCVMCANISMHHRLTTTMALPVNVDGNICCQMQL